MRKFIVLMVGVAAVVGAVYAVRPVDFANAAATAKQFARTLRVSVEANPVPVFIALGTFLATIGYHSARGKSFRESVEAAATRVTLVSVPTRDDSENAVVTRAKARATRTQLLADQVLIENRVRKLPGEIVKAEKEVCYVEAAVAETKLTLELRTAAHIASMERLDVLRLEKIAGDEELAAIRAELKKLANVV